MYIIFIYKIKHLDFEYLKCPIPIFWILVSLIDILIVPQCKWIYLLANETEYFLCLVLKGLSSLWNGLWVMSESRERAVICRCFRNMLKTKLDKRSIVCSHLLYWEFQKKTETVHPWIWDWSPFSSDLRKQRESEQHTCETVGHRVQMWPYGILGAWW